MKILAIDSSGLVAGVALLEDEELIAEYTVQYKKTHSQTLLPMLEEIGRMVELDLASLDAIAVAAGPGSFTGLRIGCATAKGLGQALGKPLVAVPTVDALAYNLYGCDNRLICPMMDARRNQVYTGIYTFYRSRKGFRLETLKEQCAMDVGELLEELNGREQEVIFLGDGVPVFKGLIEERLKIPYSFAPAGFNRQRAAALGVLALTYLEEGKTVSAADMKPEYLRMSQAERERKEGRTHGV